MDINRNQYFMLGLVVLFIGLQLRAVSSYMLNEKATQFLAKRSAALTQTSDSSVFGSSTATPAITTGSRKVLQLPEWSGWALLSVGSVLVLHSLAMKRPD